MPLPYCGTAFPKGHTWLIRLLGRWYDLGHWPSTPMTVETPHDSWLKPSAWCDDPWLRMNAKNGGAKGRPRDFLTPVTSLFLTQDTVKIQVHFPRSKPCFSSWSSSFFHPFCPQSKPFLSIFSMVKIGKFPEPPAALSPSWRITSVPDLREVPHRDLGMIRTFGSQGQPSDGGFLF